MRKIAVVNFKGGTGKTTTVVNMGAGLANRGNRVLLVDADAQGSLALSLGLPFSKSLSDALKGDTPIHQCIIQARKNLDIVPSDNSLLLAQRMIPQHAKWQYVLDNLLHPVEEQYDFIVLDCAASITLLNINALIYAEEIFVPTQVEYLSLAGLNQVLENLARVRFPNRPRQEVLDLGISLIVPTMYDVRMSQSRRLLNELRQTYGRRVALPIRINVRLSEAPAYQQTIFEYAPKSRGAFDYNRLADLILQNTLLVGEEPIGLQRPFQPPRVKAATHIEGIGDRETPEPETRPMGQIDETSLETHEEAAQIPIWATARSLPQCPHCHIPLSSLEVAGYRVYHCERCGYQKQILQRDLQAR